MSSMQMSSLLTMQMSWLLTMQMSWLQTQQMSWLQTSMWLPKKAASGGFFPAKTTISSKKVRIFMVFVTFRLILTQKPSKTIQILKILASPSQILANPSKCTKTVVVLSQNNHGRPKV